MENGMVLQKVLPFIAVVVLALTTGCAARPAQGECEFKYDESMQSGFIVPLLKKEYGDAFPYLNYDSPIVQRRGNYIDLIFGTFKTVNGKTALYEDVFVVTIDPCTRKIISTHIESPG
jgi:hypothetical protein